MFAYSQRSHRDFIAQRKERATAKRLSTNAFVFIAALGTVFLNASFIDKFFNYEDTQSQPSRTMRESAVVRLRRLSNSQFPFSSIANPSNARMNRRIESVEKKRFALVRTFSPNDYKKLPASFDSWEVFTPCADVDFESRYAVDIILSYSQVLSTNAEAQAAVDEVIERFRDKEGWGKCFGEVHTIEANIPPEYDLYEPSSIQTNPLWVSGPNTQFIHSYRSVQRSDPKYEAMIAMEPDSQPRRERWLEALLNEVEENTPLAMLGSKYDGHSWDSFLDAIPVALLHHINGNAVYNISHPYMNLIVNELQAEQNTMFNSVPYDYRISQMVVEGSLGITPEFPHKYMKDQDRNPFFLEPKPKFKEWWNDFKDDNPMKESAVITNFAATNFLPSHVEGAAIVHGQGLYEPHDPNMKITLVVSDWDKDHANHLVSLIDQSNHPFSEVIVMRPPQGHNFATRAFMKLWESIKLKAKIPVHVQHRASPDYMDICDAKVDTEWFMMTNSYHQVNYDVDLMFTPESKKPVIPYTPALIDFCTDFTACRETVDIAKDFFPNTDKVVLDFDMLFKTDLRNEFCSVWREKFGEVSQALSLEHSISPETSKGPTATSFVAYLYQQNFADQTYLFSDRTLRGAQNQFMKVFHEEEYKNYQDVMGDVMRHTSRKMQEMNVPSATPVQLGIGEKCSNNDQCESNFCEEGECKQNQNIKLAFGKAIGDGDRGIELLATASDEEGSERDTNTKNGAVLLVCVIVGMFAILVMAAFVSVRRADSSDEVHDVSAEEDAYIGKGDSAQEDAYNGKGDSAEVDAMVMEGDSAQSDILVGNDTSAKVDANDGEGSSADVDVSAGNVSATEVGAFAEIDISSEVDASVKEGASSGLDASAKDGDPVGVDASDEEGASASEGSSAGKDDSAGDDISTSKDIPAGEDSAVKDNEIPEIV